MKILLIILLLIFPNLVIAQNITVIDNSTISVSNPPTIYSIDQLKAKLDDAKERLNEDQNIVNDIQNKIDTAAQNGASAADAVSSPSVQQSLQAKVSQ